VGCTTTLSIREGRIVRARGVDGVGMNEGDLCPRGRFGFDYIESEQRLSTPLLRKGANLEPVSWQEAFDFISRRLSEIKERNGARAIGALGSERCSVEDNYMLKKLMQNMGTDNIDSRMRFGYAKTSDALQKAFGIKALPVDLRAPLEADVLFVVESDLTSTHPIYGLKLLAAKRDFGATLITADPKQTKLARWATRWLRLRPATGAALVNGVMKAMIDEGLHDKKAEAVSGFGELKKALDNYTPEKAAVMTGISAEDIRQTARTLAGAKNPMLFASVGSNENTKGTALMLAIMDLCILLGRGPEALGLPAEYANTLGLLEVGLKPNGGMGAEEMLYEPALKALYIMGENPVVTFPDAARVEETLRGIELLIVQDIFLTETAKLAHVVLPAASWAEKEGIFVGATGRPQKFIKCLPETGLSTADWKILRNLGRAMQMDMGAKDEQELDAEISQGLNFCYTAKPSLAFVPVEQEVAETTDGSFPFVMATGNLMQHSGSLTTISKNISSARPDAYVEINPADAKARGVTDEGFAKVTARSGAAIYLKARVTDEVPEGMLFVPAHFAHARVNLLTHPSANGEAPTVAVKIEKA
jgi:formate dehydrogenase alpha subunit